MVNGNANIEALNKEKTSTARLSIISNTLLVIQDLPDIRLSGEEEGEIKRILSDHSGSCVEFHELRTRKSGSDRLVDLHRVVNKKLSLEEAHGLSEHIENDIKERFPRTSVIIHIEPCEDDVGNCKGRRCHRPVCREHEEPGNVRDRAPR